MSNHYFLPIVLSVTAACFCILCTVGLSLVLNYFPQYSWNGHCLSWFAVTLALQEKNLRVFAPMFLIWLFWISLQSEIQNYWRLVDNHSLPAGHFSSPIYTASVVLLGLIGNFYQFQRFRTASITFYGIIFSGLLVVLIPKPRIGNELLALQQVASFVLIYLASHVLVEIQTPSVALNWKVKILLSNWILWITNPMASLICLALFLFGATITVLQNPDGFNRYLAMETANAERNLDIENPAGKQK